MSKSEFLGLFSRHHRRIERKEPEQVKQTLTYNLRLPGKTFTELSSDPDISGEDTLRVMPPDADSKPTIQPLSLPEKKYLYHFWSQQWEIFKAAPACQNISEKRLREKFDGYVSINIRRYLIKNWNNTFAGGFVAGEPEARHEREVDDLRALTKTWGWLCKELGFKLWPLSIDHENENLENVRIDVRGVPFTMSNARIEADSQARRKITEDRQVVIQKLVSMQAEADTIYQQTGGAPAKLDSKQEKIIEDYQTFHGNLKAEIAATFHMLQGDRRTLERLAESTIRGEIALLRERSQWEHCSIDH